jgi:hypothetical protein
MEDFKRFTQALDGCLNQFDSINEWADIINFLSKLSKLISSFPQFQVLPRYLALCRTF